VKYIDTYLNIYIYIFEINIDHFRYKSLHMSITTRESKIPSNTPPVFTQIWGKE